MTVGSMSKISIVCLCLLAAFNGCAGRLNVTEQMMWSTYPVITQSGMATGFVMEGKDRKGGALPVMVTPLHVVQLVGKGPLYVGTRIANSRGEPQGAVIQLIPPKRGRFYVRHSSLDLAAFPLQLPESVRAQVSMPTFLKESSIGSGLNSLRSGSEVFFLGFPDVLPGTPGAFPVLRSGRIASYPVRERMSEGLFLIDADVYPGDSGAPVFVAGPGRHPRLVGMVVRRIGTDAQRFSHLAVAIEAGAIRETVRIFAQKTAVPPVTTVVTRKPANRR